MGVLSGILKATGAGFRGYALDEKQRVTDVLAQQKAAREARQLAVTEALAGRTLRTPVLGDPNYAKARGEVAGAEADATVPAKTAVAAAGVGAQTQVHQTNRRFDIANPLPVPPSFSPVVTTAPGGKQVVTPFDTKHGTMGAPVADAKAGVAAALAAPMAAKVGQFGEMLKKAHDLLPAMEALDVSLGQSTAQDVAAHGVKIPLLGVHIPGTQGMGARAVNNSPQYATYQASLTPFVLAAAHALSGARINDEQVRQIRQSIEIQPGEPTESRKQKVKNLVDLINSIGGSLPADAIGAQEGQMDPAQLTRMEGYGYRRRSGAVARPSITDLLKP